MSIFLVITAFVTSAVSGVLGMAGGAILMGVLVTVLPVAAAMIAHGVTQLASNGFRAFLLRRWILWRVIGFYVVGALPAMMLLSLIAFAPSGPAVFLFLGLVALSATRTWRAPFLDIQTERGALLCGFVVTSVNLAAGIAGPLLDAFFMDDRMGRREIVATKAFTQAVSHSFKIVYYGVIVGVQASVGINSLLLAAMAAAALAGTTVGRNILERLSDRSFFQVTRAVLGAIGALYLARAFWGFAGIA
jgi:uncharacterized membrane protein YfcA